MLHLRAIAPKERTGEVCAVLDDNPGVTNVMVLPDAAVRPPGDVVMCDVAREAVNDVLDELRTLGVDRDGSIALERVDVSVSHVAEQAEEVAPGHGDDAVVWEELDQQTSEATHVTWSFVAFLTLATQLAAIGVLIDSQILIVGAMVLGPEFGPVAAICYGLVRRDPRRIGRAVVAILTGFAVAILLTLVLALIARWVGWIGNGMLDHNPQTNFIVSPDRWSFVVALLAGGAGVLSITAAKSSALVGVFISVTTVPAAGNIADAIALQHGAEIRDSLIQLSINLAGMIVAGTVTLLVQRTAWALVPKRGRRYAARMTTPRRPLR